ncbi:ImmA/IrrE family metallo-endopeptidase [Corallococcus exiguus]|uniref:ImmA/IrrE family metallo-endopeptidase n=1 Tax=Corallococcus exiguus TaxID=83462 RepID=UPI0015609496|nr:ImmA/IrrE family metallo-endopeptidase [Corallococcus exiguus]NRD45959.1 ImmA/IrrE family metallo-endopeptidase [Corallococcus exiguus]
MGEDTISMPPLRMATIEGVAEAVLAEIFPEALKKPMPVDVLHLIDNVLPAYGIHVSPAGAVEMCGNLGLTDPAGSTSIEILIQEDSWDRLQIGGRSANQARATVGHELGHAVLHVPVIRKRRSSPLSRHLLARVARREVPAYMDAEWQAWAFGGCILAPRRTILMVPNPTVSKLADIYEVSISMMEQHLRRLKLNVR